MKRKLDEGTAQRIFQTLVERFGEPIGKTETGEGVTDERSGHPVTGDDQGNHGWGSKLENGEMKTVRACPSCKGRGKVNNQRGNPMKCPTCNGRGVIKNTDPNVVNEAESTCNECGGMMQMDEAVCSQCGKMSKMEESENGGRHPGHASSCTCPDCSRSSKQTNPGLDD